MIEINLLPEELKRKSKRARRIDLFGQINIQNIKAIPILGLLAGIFAILVAIQVILFFIGIYSSALLTSMDKHYKGILPKNKEAFALKSQVEMINKKISAIDELMVKRFSWAKKLGDLSDSVTPGIWLTELSYNEALAERPASVPARSVKAKDDSGLSRPVMEKTVLKYLVVSGFASHMGEEGTALIGKFIKSLKDNAGFYSDFSDIELGAIKRDKVEEQEVMRFKITCLFKESK